VRVSLSLIPFLIFSDTISAETQKALREHRQHDAAKRLMTEHGLTSREVEDLLDIVLCKNMRNAVRSLAALLCSRRFRSASPDLAERILRKAKRIQQRAQTKPRQNSIVSEEVTQKKKDP